MGVSDFIKDHQEDVVIFGYGGANTNTERGYYHFGLACKMNLKVVEDQMPGRSANRCILEGMLAAAQQIKKPCHVIIYTSVSLGFVQAKKGKGPNADLCIAIRECLKEKGCTMELHTVENTAAEIRTLLKYPEQIFKLVK